MLDGCQESKGAFEVEGLAGFAGGRRRLPGFDSSWQVASALPLCDFDFRPYCTSSPVDLCAYHTYPPSSRYNLEENAAVRIDMLGLKSVVNVRQAPSPAAIPTSPFPCDKESR